MEKQLTGQATPEQIEQWKKDHGAVYAVEVDGHVCYLRKPDRAVMACASVALKDSPFQYLEEIFNNCKVGGSDIFDTNDDYFFAALQHVNALVELKKADIVKL